MYKRSLITKTSSTKIGSFQSIRRLATSTQQDAANPSERKPDEEMAAQLAAKAVPTPKKTTLQLDEELRQKLTGLSNKSEGGEAGVEYEDGRPADLKRSVRNNMFRYI